MAWTNWTPTVTGFSVLPTNTVYLYRRMGNTVELNIRQGANGTSNSTSFTISLPFTAATITNMVWVSSAYYAINNNAGTSGIGTIASGATVISFGSDFAGSVWNANNGKRVTSCFISYQCA